MTRADRRVIAALPCQPCAECPHPEWCKDVDCANADCMDEMPMPSQWDNDQRGLRRCLSLLLTVTHASG